MLKLKIYNIVHYNMSEFCTYLISGKSEF